MINFDFFFYQDYRLDFSSQKEILESQKDFLKENNSLTFTPTVCVVRYAGKNIGNDNGNNNQNDDNNKNQTFQTEFTNWLDADFWTDLGPKGEISIDGKDDLKRNLFHDNILTSIVIMII